MVMTEERTAIATSGDYARFLAAKAVRADPCGFRVEDGDLVPALFDWQRALVRWAVRRGKAALFADCGLGKSLMQLEWARQVCRHTGGDVLILAPLAVAQQTAREGEKFGIAVTVCTDEASVRPGINVTNYEKLHRFSDLARFAGVVADECFPKGTLIDTPSGKVSIENVKIGSEIVNAFGVDTVSDVHRREVKSAIRIAVNGRHIISSPNHPYFTQRGWVGAQDLVPGDCIAHTATAMRLVRHDLHAKTGQCETSAVLRSILLSEMAYEPAGTCSEIAYAGRGAQAWRQAPGMDGVRRPESRSGARTHTGAEPDERCFHAPEGEPHIESHAPRTFRAWGQRAWFDGAATDTAGCTRTELDTGICFITGQADSRLSHALQDRLSQSRAQNRHRGGWELALQPQSSGWQEGCETGFARMDGLEVLEPGHPDLEQLRDADGHIYFYDLGATRHPSFSVGGLLVHNSSILKSVDGKTKAHLMEAFSRTPYRLACTATPAPNDYMELGNHAEFLGIMTRAEMLAMFFTHDGGDVQSWRLKGHAEDAFWRWVCSWAAMVRTPSDLGYDGASFILPPLQMHEHVVAVDAAAEGMLFAVDARTLTEQRAARRGTLAERAQVCADLVNASGEPWLVWCDLNAEGDLLERLIPDAVQVSGSDDDATKEARMLGFAAGEHRVLVSKSSICGFGMNWQHCPNVAFVGVSHSFEAFYQAIRRCWRFGQTRPVQCHVISAETEGAVVANLKRKERDASRMAEGMLGHMSAIMQDEIRDATHERADYRRATERGRDWTLHLGDSVEVVAEMDEGSIDYCLFSPPFQDLYTYSNSERDMGNVRDADEFEAHFGYLIAALYRALKPGRLLSFHCMNLPSSKVRHGYIGIRDFRGDLIRMFQAAGFIYHSEVVIWKDPVTAMQRTKALGLLYKQLRKDSAMSRQGIPDYLVTMRKPGVNPDPVTKDAADFPVDLWQRYASPVWMDINPSDTLQYTMARDAQDERHICPLQIQVVDRAIELWTNPGDTVLDPFAGIGSVPHQAVLKGRRGVGVELKPSYFMQAVRNLRNAEQAAHAPTLFDLMDDGDAEAV